MKTFDTEILFRPPTDQLRFLPEGPFALDGDRFSWVAIGHGADATHGSLNIFDLTRGENRSIELSGRPGFAFPTDQTDTFVIGLERQLQLFNIQSGEYRPLGDPVEVNVQGTIINDGVAFEHGLIFGCKDLKFSEKKAGLYFFRSRDGRMIQLRSDQICSNGKVISRDGQSWTLLDIDTPTKTVVAYELDIDAGKIGAPRVVVDLRGDDAFPDGMVGTPDGRGVIVSFYNPNDAPHGETRQYNVADGRCEAVWQTPASPQATCPQLVRHDGRIKIVITTAVEHMPPERQATYPNAGCLFIGETDFDALPEQPPFRIST